MSVVAMRASCGPLDECERDICGGVYVEQEDEKRSQEYNPNVEVSV